MSCIFCRILQGALAACRVYEDSRIVAFLDHRPLFPGHTLIVPREHVETLPELAPELLSPLFAVVQKMSAAVPAALGARGTFVALNNRVSQSVPHLHVHVVPRSPKDGLKGFFWPRHPYRDDAHMEETATAIRACLEELRG
ncbi:MAG: HIT family protein [Armatimonadetes bacterium]|nr:HIT family protein [Armatimonadota bacterium]